MGLTGVNHVWTAAEDTLLGKISDGDAARRIGLTPLSIFLRRKKLGIPAYKPEPTPKPRIIQSAQLIRKNKQARATIILRKAKPWTPAEIALLGTDADLEIGNKLGRTKAAVQKERRLRRIPAIGDRRPRIKSWGAVELLLFEQYSDAELAKLSRRDVKEVTAMRRKLRKRTR